MESRLRPRRRRAAGGAVRARGRLTGRASVASRPSKLLAVEAVASLLEAPEAVAPPAPAPEEPYYSVDPAAAKV